MKKILLTLFSAVALIACNNQPNPPHGETGHQCTEECMKMMEKEKSSENKSMEMEMKEHVCTDVCKDGQHHYAHGEKGHQCSEECMKMNSK